MTDNLSKMSCDEFQAHLPELVAAGGNVADHEHVKSCDLCRALLADLETIAEAARQLFPSVEPPDKLWAKIESAIKSGDEPDPKVDLPARLAPQHE
ncbi:MAG TPA: hypothetical protein VHX20_07300 [Terracidiphilus sp.]|jgi:hypothetical protein|nr:hypothetical protein [Terracidiphilus sp.]